MSTIKDHRSSIGSVGRRIATPLKKVHFQLPTNLKGTFLNFTNGLDHRPYQDLVCILRDSEVKDEELCLLLRDAQDCVSLLDQNLRLFIQVLLYVKWAHRGPETVAAFQNFLLDLCSAHNYHTNAVLHHLVTCFRTVSEELADTAEGFPSAEETRAHQNIHYVLIKLLKVVPMAGELMVTTLNKLFPYYKDKPRICLSYVHNILQILSYQPKYKQDILQMLFNSLIQFDVNAPRSDIDSAEDNEDDMEVDMFSEKDETMKHPVANSLDILMMRIFLYIKTECSDPITGETTLERCYAAYKDFLQVFQKQILLTHNTHHVQFTMWYICSLRPKLAEVFIKHLWQLVTSVHVPPVTRQSAVAYVSSFLARASFIRLEYVKVVIQDMADWIHSYINNQDGQKGSEMKLHTVFYSVCQGLFYLVCFKHKDLFRTKHNMVFLRGLNLTKVVTCSLNPLKVCLPEIVKKFAAITRAYQLVYCNSVIERNSRNTVPIIYSKNSFVPIDQTTLLLDTFFPFDPYRLLRSSSFINDHYNVYQDDDIPEENHKTDKADNDDDDFLAEPMSTSLTDKRFTYSASPGFLHDHSVASHASPRWKHLV
ncbi:hypothetical protein ONE63_005450 [Megalurothrips usitatus]|nr:hypothetical protein ONE63_005450 [Megalurothrips usitatus]